MRTHTFPSILSVWYLPPMVGNDTYYCGCWQCACICSAICVAVGTGMYVKLPHCLWCTSASEVCKSHLQSMLVTIIFIAYNDSFSPHKKYLTPSRTPKIAIYKPTFASLKDCDILSPATITGQYHCFLIFAHTKRPTFFSSISQCLQNAESQIQNHIPSHHEVWQQHPH